jgi:hypothetical protein
VHELTRDTIAENGDELWSCPSCERRLVVSWQPDFRRTVLATGDPDVPHSGTKGPLSLGSVSVHRTPHADDQRWLREAGIDWHGVSGPSTE